MGKAWVLRRHWVVRNSAMRVLLLVLDDWSVLRSYGSRGDVLVHRRWSGVYKADGVYIRRSVQLPSSQALAPLLLCQKKSRREQRKSHSPTTTILDREILRVGPNKISTFKEIQRPYLENEHH